MVDVCAKEETLREAHAEANVHLSALVLEKIIRNEVPKGNVFEAARVAGIIAAKRTWELIPLCHPIRLTLVDLDFIIDEPRSLIRIRSKVRTKDRTGVEIEALVAVTHAALTIYDMCKAIDHSITIGDIHLTFKTGGKSGTYQSR